MLSPGELYKMAIDEMRFQVTHNWSRTQYLLGFNAAILAGGAAVAGRPGRSASLVFILGMAAAVLSAAAVRTEHGYYRAARDRMRKIEETVVPPDRRVNTTTTLGGEPRAVSVTQVVYLLLAAMAAADVVGALVVLLG